MRHRALVLGLLCSVAAACASAPGADVIRIERVALAESEQQPGADSPAWRAARLPNDWRPRGNGVPIWCRAEFSLEATPREPLQLLVVSAGYGAEVFLNGSEVAVEGRPPDAIFGRREGIWVSLPPALLAAGTNVLLLRIAVRPDFAGFLTPLRVGSPDALQSLHAYASAFSVLPDVLALFALLGAVFQWMAYRSEPRSEWLWITAAFLAMALGNWRWRAIDFWLWPLAMAVGTTFVVCGIHRASGIVRRPLELASFASLALLAGALVWGPPPWRLALAAAAGTVSIALACYLLNRYRDPRAASWLVRPRLVAAGVASCMVIAINDAPLYYLGRAPLLGVPLVPVCHAFLLLASVFQVLIFLGDRLSQVRALHGALEASHGRVVQLEREQAARGERVRLQRELHDGVGAQLVSALAVAERADGDGQTLRSALRGALGELRVAVDSLDDVESELVEVLGRLRARLEPLVHGAGIDFSWQVGDVASARRIPPEHAIHLLRVLQEAIANAVKHAAPRRIEVRSGDDGADGVRVPFVEVRDDGRGFASPAAGRGLANMRARAEQIGGRVEIASDAEGTRVRLWLAPS